MATPPVVVPCAPCLHALLTGQADQPHACDVVTTVTVERLRLVIIADLLDCPCDCPNPEESQALEAARAAARRRPAQRALARDE